MSDNSKELGRLLESVDQNSKNQEKLWKEIARTRADLHQTSKDLVAISADMKFALDVVYEMQKTANGNQTQISQLDTEMKSNRRWIKTIATIVAAAIPVVLTQVLAKSDLIGRLDSRVSLLEWKVSKEEYYGTRDRIPPAIIPTSPD